MKSNSRRAHRKNNDRSVDPVVLNDSVEVNFTANGDCESSSHDEIFMSPKKQHHHHHHHQQQQQTSPNDLDNELCFDISPQRFLQSLKEDKDFHNDDNDDYLIMLKSHSSMSVCTFDDYCQASTASFFSNYDDEYTDYDCSHEVEQNIQNDEEKKDEVYEQEEDNLNYRRLCRRRVQFGIVSIQEYANENEIEEKEEEEKEEEKCNVSNETTMTTTWNDSVQSMSTLIEIDDDDDESDCESVATDDEISLISKVTTYSFSSVDEHDQYIQRQRRINVLYNNSSTNATRSPTKQQRRRYVLGQQQQHQQHKKQFQQERHHTLMSSRAA
jgi:hypothetical protein